MKKTILCLLVLLMAISFFGCTPKEDDSTQTLTLDEKYVFGREDSKNYYIFYADGTGKFSEYNFVSDNSPYNNEYEVTFKYEIIEDVVICLYDSVVFGENHGHKEIPSLWRSSLGFSKNLLVSTSDPIYVREGHLPNFPNYGK